MDFVLQMIGLQGMSLCFLADWSARNVMSADLMKVYC